MLNQRRLWFWTAALVLLGMLMMGCQSSYEYQGNLLDPPLPLSDFELTATDGQPFHLSDIEGDIALIYFGYTFCPDVCPLTMNDIREALEGLEGRERVHVLFITADPERDTPEALARYVSVFDPSFIGLTDDYAKIETVMKDYGAFAERVEMAGSDAEYLINHTARVYLVGPERELLLTYPFGFETEELRSDLEHLLESSVES